MLRLAGKMEKAGKYWAIEVPLLYVFTQGRTKKEAFEMLKDAIESLAEEQDFFEVIPGSGERFEICSKDAARFTAFILKRQRQKQGLSLSDMSKRLGRKSRNTYARFEQGKSDPTISNLLKLLSAVNSCVDITISETDR
jgi:predicted RNase H-like HicB family nuclease/DNA-binding XRE family transcriptional regulator